MRTNATWPTIEQESYDFVLEHKVLSDQQKVILLWNAVISLLLWTFTANFTFFSYCWFAKLIGIFMKLVELDVSKLVTDFSSLVTLHTADTWSNSWKTCWDFHHKLAKQSKTFRFDFSQTRDNAKSLKRLNFYKTGLLLQPIFSKSEKLHFLFQQVQKRLL